jgi:hypothetical protein
VHLHDIADGFESEERDTKRQNNRQVPRSNEAIAAPFPRKKFVHLKEACRIDVSAAGIFSQVQ